MARILFVEDHVELIEELLELLQAERADLNVAVASDIPDALGRLRQRFDAVVLDIMLPAFRQVPSQSEGLHLAAWILGKHEHLGDALRSVKRPDWLRDSLPKVVFLTSRTKGPAIDEWRRLGGEPGEALAIERLLGDAYEHCQEVLRWIEGKRDAHD